MTTNEFKDLTIGVPEDEQLSITGLKMDGAINTDHEEIYANIRYSIRQQHPQIWQQSVNNEVACIVCGGESLNTTEEELVALWHDGAKIFTMNGSYNWCLERNIKPYAQIIVDARKENARFLYPDRPNIRYFLASQCHRESWDAVADRPLVGIWHAVSREDPASAILDDYYLKSWTSILGGTTVGTCAIGLCRTLGFIRLHIFGMDCCYLNERGHAYQQDENNDDPRIQVTFQPGLQVELSRVFEVTPWHIKNMEDVLRVIKHGGEHFVFKVHGDGLLAYALSTNAVYVKE